MSGKLTVVQMAKRMDFSVVGLPHYTIWHLYEPSVDDIKHMEVRALLVRRSDHMKLTTKQDMEQERISRESEEKERAEKAKKIKEQFDDPNKQWEKDKTDLEALAKDALAKEERQAAKHPAGSGDKAKGGSIKMPERAAGEK